MQIDICLTYDIVVVIQSQLIYIRDRSLAGAITEFRLMQDMIQVIHVASSF